ncbi:MAG: hypothetical protein DRP42_01400 [Tenericutes bacterium]|nr:MAG: hypothetical protein DRP42_01400 [Mycoplasmatota bacterium]
MAKLFNLKIITAQGTALDTDAELLTIRIENGFIGILAEHVPIISNIRACHFTVEGPNKYDAFVGDGVLKVSPNGVTILTTKLFEKDSNKSEITEALKSAKELLSSATTPEEIKVLNDSVEYYNLILGESK